MDLQQVSDAIRTVPDFPEVGIQFKDITTALKQPDILRYVSDETVKKYKDKGITKVVGVESRGFILGAILAYHLNAGFVLLRKPGKLPAETFKVDYVLEYGTNTLELHKDALEEEDVVLMHDDLLATGGSAEAALQLISKFNVQKTYLDFMVELSFLNGRDRLTKYGPIESLIAY